MDECGTGGRVWKGIFELVLFICMCLFLEESSGDLKGSEEQYSKAWLRRVEGECRKSLGLYVSFVLFSCE